MKSFLRFLLKPLAFVPALVMIFIIFNFSQQPGDVSAGLSLKISRKLLLQRMKSLTAIGTKHKLLITRNGSTIMYEKPDMSPNILFWRLPSPFALCGLWTKTCCSVCDFLSYMYTSCLL